MKYIELKEQLNNFKVFTLSDIKKLEPDFDKRRLSEWQDKGYLKRIRRGYYIFSDLNINEETLYLIANKLYAPSYISLEMALSHYGLIPEGVYTVTSISTKRANNFKTLIAEFNYHIIRPDLFFGYRLEINEGQGYKIAEIEKAVLDYLYLNPEMSQDEDFSEWRFNGQEFENRYSKEKFLRYLDVFDNKSLKKRARRLIKYVEAENARY